MANDANLPLPAFDELVGLRLSIVRRAADMLVLHFGDIVPHRSGRGDVGQIALHIQGPWRLDYPTTNTIVGRDDLWKYGGTRPEPEGWSYENGESVQDVCFDRLFRRGESNYGWAVNDGGYAVLSVEQTATGDLRFVFVNGRTLLVFPDGVSRECWRLFKPGGAEHYVFPPEYD